MVFYLFMAGFLLFSQAVVFPQLKRNLNGEKTQSCIPANLSHKIGSGDLLRLIEEKNAPSFQQSLYSFGKSSAENNFLELAVYTEQVPASSEIISLSRLGISGNPGSWTPPSKDHPYGFFIARVPVNQLINALNLDFIKRIESAGDLCFPQNNEAAKRIKADVVWNQGFKGNGIRIAVLDSGLDMDFSGTEFPLSIDKKDYSNYPTLDDNIENSITGHGTHVTGSLLSRGVLSEENTANGTGPYRGIAPESELIFLKIGNDLNGGAKTSAITEALKAAVEIYHADIITMSYGSWDIYHDGSNVKDQAIDWCYSMGVPVFIPAGNDAENRRHYSGSLEAQDSSEFIRVNVADALLNSTYLAFNLVWSDNAERKNLGLKYYNDRFEELTNIYHWTTTESPRGTESKLSQSLFTVPEGESIFYLKVFNYSGSSQDYHIYEHYNDGKVTFQNADPNYTIVSPATADHAFAVGSYVTRIDWISYNGSVSTGSQDVLGSIYSYSGRGPRIDGVQKPDIVAPGSSIISLRDEDVYTIPNSFFIDNDGNPSGGCDYMVMEGTSMSAPFCAGAAALFLQKFPDASPEEVYNALRSNAVSDDFTGNGPSTIYGFGKLDISAALKTAEDPLPVELNSFTGTLQGNLVKLEWKTATEVNNFGFEVERSQSAEQSGNENLQWEVIGFVKGSCNSNSAKEYSFTDENLYGSALYHYRLKQIDNDGSFSYSEEVKLNINLIPGFELQQNYPNPFNSTTTFEFRIPAVNKGGNNSVRVSLKIFDMLGQEVVSVLNEEKEPGNYKILFNILSAGLTSGTYFYKLQAGDFNSTRKMIYLK